MEQERIWDYFQNEGLKNHAFPEARQRFMLKYLKAGQTVLDIGVGSGALERLALTKGVDIHALDPSERAIKRLREELKLGDKARVGYAQQMPFTDRQFDVVIMSEVLEHLDDETLSRALREVWRVLKPGGFLLASTPYREDLGRNTTVCPYCGKVFHKVGHVQSFDKALMADILTMHGYEIRKLYVTTFADWHRRGLKNFLKSSIRVFLARLGEGVADPHLKLYVPIDR